MIGSIEFEGTVSGGADFRIMMARLRVEQRRNAGFRDECDKLCLMRRILSLAMLLVFCFPLIAPLFASGPETSLPACCRRDGAHHCSMGTAMLGMQGGTRWSSLQSKCPNYPKAVTVAGVGHWFLVKPQMQFADVVAHPSARPQTEARYRISFGRSRQKRGPPSSFL